VALLLCIVDDRGDWLLQWHDYVSLMIVVIGFFSDIPTPLAILAATGGSAQHGRCTGGAVRMEEIYKHLKNNGDVGFCSS